MDTKEKIAVAQWMLERQLGWIAAAEIKVGAIVTIDLAMLGSLSASLGAVAERTAWMYVISALAAIPLLLAVLHAASAINPKLEGPNKSLLFFGRVKEFDCATYVDQLKAATPEVILHDWAKQIHRNAEIACLKHSRVRVAMAMSILAAAPWIFAIVFQTLGSK